MGRRGSVMPALSFLENAGRPVFQLVLAILDRPGILPRRDGIGVADFALAVVDANLAPAGALDDLLSALLGCHLRGEPAAGSLGVGAP
jgi:hypothetical protein